MKINIVYKFILNKIILPLGDRIFNTNYRKKINEWQYYDNLNIDTLNKIQRERLFQILIHARETVPFYKKKIPKKFNEDQAYSVLKKIPILTKDLLSEKNEELLSNRYIKSDLIKNHSSGSTGKQSFSYSLKKEIFNIQAIQRHWFFWTGYEDGDHAIQFGISPKRGFIKKLKDYFFNIHYYSAFSLSEKDFSNIYKKLKAKKIKYIIGYPSAINELSKYMINYGLQHSVKAIISLGDKLFDHYKSNFDKSFCRPNILDTYGCAEGFMIAAKYDLDYYYISSPHIFVEIVNDQGKYVDDGEIGHVLVTGLTNYTQPFFRYKLGDMAIKLPASYYPNKRKFNYPLLQKIVGRETEVIETPDNKKLIIHSFTGIFEHFPEIKQFKIIQNDIDSLIIRYICENVNEKKILNTIQRRIEEITNKTMKIKFEKVEEIKSYHSGKPQLIEVRNFNKKTIS